MNSIAGSSTLPPKRITRTARITKIMTSHLAILMLNPAIPLAPRTYATRARTKNTTANQIRPSIVSPTLIYATIFININVHYIFC
jgi:hypothetical protein